MISARECCLGSCDHVEYGLQWLGAVGLAHDFDQGRQVHDFPLDCGLVLDFAGGLATFESVEGARIQFAEESEEVCLPSAGLVASLFHEYAEKRPERASE